MSLSGLTGLVGGGRGATLRRPAHPRTMARRTGREGPRVAVDAVLLHEDKLVLVRRGKPPFRGRYALPGGGVEFGERLEEAVEREVLEETGLESEVMRLLGVYGDPGRDPRGHTISIAYVLRSIGGTLMAGSDAAAT